ncbi:hypothetical protein [Ruegeria meonggei]|uniref:hypothetical protein n=1 Tax=Ruegeria meonggei TaxID=1446476 RepID=UPI00366AB3CB
MTTAENGGSEPIVPNAAPCTSSCEALIADIGVGQDSPKLPFDHIVGAAVQLR